MKKISLIILSIFFCASLAWGDEVDDGLSNMATEQIRIHTRAMINAGIPSDDAIKMTRMMIQNRFQHKNTLRAQQIVMDTAKKNLPIEPVMNKAFEGIAKNALENQVIQAMEKTRNRYSYAYSHSREFTNKRGRTDNIGNAIAKGLVAGMYEKDIERTSESLQERTRQMTRTRAEILAEESFLALRTMARLGVSSKMAADTVCQALQQQYSAKEMKQMHHSFMTRSMSTNPAKLAYQYTHAIRKGVRAGNLDTNQTGKPTQNDHTGGSGSSDGSGGSGSSGGHSGRK